MPEHHTSPTHYLFLRIVAIVGQSSKSVTVNDLAKTLRTPAEVIAQCIALHLYMERKRVAELPLPPPADYWVPADCDVISPDLLRPKSTGRMLAVDAAIRDALGASNPTVRFSPIARFRRPASTRRSPDSNY
jgi:hypothetical protein